MRKGPKKEEGIVLSTGLYRLCVYVCFGAGNPQEREWSAICVEGPQEAGGDSIVKGSIGAGRVCVCEEGPKKKEGVLLSRGPYGLGGSAICEEGPQERSIQVMCVCVIWSRKSQRKGRVCAYVRRGLKKREGILLSKGLYIMGVSGCFGGGNPKEGEVTISKWSIEAGRVCEKGPQDGGGDCIVKTSIQAVCVVCFEAGNPQERERSALCEEAPQEV